MAENTMLQTVRTLQHDIKDVAASPHDAEKWQHVFQELKTELQNFKGNNAAVIAMVAGFSLKDAGLIDKHDIIRGIGAGDNEIMVFRTAHYDEPGTLVEVTSHGVENPYAVHPGQCVETTDDPHGVEKMNGAYHVWLDPYKPDPYKPKD